MNILNTILNNKANLNQPEPEAEINPRFGPLNNQEKEIKTYYVNNNFNYKNIFFSWQLAEDKIIPYVEEIYSAPANDNYRLYEAIKLEHGIGCNVDLKKSYKKYLESAFIDHNYFAFYMLYKLHITNTIEDYYSAEAEEELDISLGLNDSQLNNLSKLDSIISTTSDIISEKGKIV